LSLIFEVRQKEKAEYEKKLEEVRMKGGEYAELVRAEMGTRLEKQV
jgi:hypothetical protein